MRALGFAIGGAAAVILAVLTVVLQRSPEPAAAQAAQPCDVFDGAGVSYFEVPAGVTQIQASVYGAEGGLVLPANPQYGLPGQGGGVVGAVIPVTPGEVLEIRVGGAGLNSNGAQTPAPPGGFNGGGAGAVGSAHTSSTGGGASAILRGSQTLVIGGGGGGAAHGGGGGDGGLVGTDGTRLAGSTAGSTGGLAGGTGGTGGDGNPASQAGGNGGAGQGGAGGGDATTVPVDGGGGGGGGYVGGGGGGGGPGNGGAGGGGGSSFDASGTATFETGVETGDGRVTLSYNCVPQPQSCVTFTTPGTHSFQVPPWVREVDAQAFGAQGGDYPDVSSSLNGVGGLGGGATGLPIPVTPGETLDVVVGARGANGGGSGAPAPAGGAPGGGDGGAETGFNGAGGGGASAIRRGAQTLFIVGGGGGAARGGHGGAGGFAGTDGARVGNLGGFGGRSGGNGGTGGAGTLVGQNGSAGQGGVGAGDLGAATTTGGGGGGGAGAVGGGGGGSTGTLGGGGGGGSSAQSLGQVAVAWHTGVETGDGRVELSYDCAGTDLSIEKQASAGTVTAGGQVMYTLIVRNNGPADDTGVTVTDSIPAGLDVVSAVSGQGSCQIAAAVTCSLGDLAAGGSTQILVTANVGSSVSGDVTNTAEVDGDRDDPDPTNNRDERTITVDPPPPPPPPAVDLKVKKAVSATQANPGDQLTYTLVVTNDGPGDATKVKLVDTPPGQIRYVAAQPAQGKCAIEAGVLECSLGELPADGQTQVLVTAEVQPGASGALRNVATVTAAEEDRNPKNNLDRQEVTVPRPGGPQPSSELQITKKASKVTSSGRVTYTLVARNNGPDTAHDAVVVDTASRPVKVLSLKTSKGSCKVGPPIRCKLGSLAARQRVEIRIVAKLTEPGKLTNAASVASSDEDAKPKNNLAKAQSRLQPRLRLVKRALATGAPKGGEVAFAIGIRNLSSVAVRNVRVCDPLPDGLGFKSAEPRASRDGDRVCWRIRKLGAGKSRSFQIVTIMRASDGRVTNRATATAPGVRAVRGSAGVNAGGAAGDCVGAARRTPRLC